MKFENRVVEVLTREIDNHRNVYLFLEGENWCAYERSAYYLYSLNVPLKIDKKIVNGGYEIILVKAHINKRDLDFPICNNAVLKSVSDTSLIFSIKDTFKDFISWKKEKLEGTNEEEKKPLSLK